MARRATIEIPADLRTRLEAARLDLLALFRALDRMDLSPIEIPQRLIRQLFELDADYAEALWALDQPRGALDLRTMLRDTLAALEQRTEACARFRKTLPPRAHPRLAQLETSIRHGIDPLEAYNMVPRH
jgi:inorganic triphosphatase YgiF